MIQFLASVGCPPVRFTIREVWWGESRVRGIYKIDTAVGEVDRHVGERPATGEHYHTVDIECTNIDHGSELYRLIRAGKITPSESFDEKQINSPIPQLRDLVRIWWRSVVTKIRSHMSA